MDILLVELTKSISVFGLALVSFWAAIPTGFALGLHPLAIILITSVSSASGIILFVMPARFIQRRFSKYIKQSTNNDTLIMRLWQQYGVIGFGLLAPIITGAQLGAVIGIALHIPRRRLVTWMVIGVFAWSVILTLGGFTCTKLITG